MFLPILAIALGVVSYFLAPLMSIIVSLAALVMAIMAVKKRQKFLPIAAVVITALLFARVVVILLYGLWVMLGL